MTIGFSYETMDSPVRKACTLTAIERFAIERSDAKSLARHAAR